MNQKVKELENKERLTDKEISFLKSVQEEDEDKLASMMKENKRKLTSLAWTTLGSSWKVSWEGRPSQTATINLGEENPLFGDFRIGHTEKGILTLKVGNWDAADPEADLALKAKAEALRAIIGNWGKFKAIFAEKAFKANEDELYSCRWQIESERRARAKDEESEAMALALKSIKEGNRFAYSNLEGHGCEISKVCPKTVRVIPLVQNGGEWYECGMSKVFKTEQLQRRIANGLLKAM